MACPASPGPRLGSRSGKHLERQGARGAATAQGDAAVHRGTANALAQERQDAAAPDSGGGATARRAAAQIVRGRTDEGRDQCKVISPGAGSTLGASNMTWGATRAPVSVRPVSSRITGPSGLPK